MEENVRKDNLMKRIIVTTLSMVLVASTLTGCGIKDDRDNTVASSGKDKVYKIGISQLVEHAALDASYQGFVDGLKEAGYEDGVNIQLDFQNAQNDQSNCNTIAAKFVNDKVDLILAIATPAAQAAANATKDIPILVTAVTDPAAASIVDTNELPGGNVTGTSDLTPVKEQMSLLLEIVPNAKKVALLYTSSEVNSKIQIDIAAEEAKKLGLETIEATISNTNEIQQVVQSLVGKVDAIYAPTDNLIASSMSTVALVTEPNNIPVICGEEGMVKQGGLATYGISYYNLGKQTALQAVKILEGSGNPATMPIEYLKDVSLFINTESADRMGITIPADLLEKAEDFE